MHREADNSSPKLSARVKIYLGSGNDLLSAPGTAYEAASLHIHPTRIQKELEHRRKQEVEGKGEYLPYSGDFDIAVVKLNKYVAFEEDTV